jgi:hypothetical protein
MDTSHPKQRLLAPLYMALSADRDVLSALLELDYWMHLSGIDVSAEELERLKDQIALRQRLIEGIEAAG